VPHPVLLIANGCSNDAINVHTEHTVGNTARRLLHHVREEYNNASKGEDTACATEFSIANFVLQGQPRRQAAELKAESTLVLKENDSDDPDSFARTLKPVVMEAIQDILDELETVYDNIAKSAKDHIHSERVLSFFLFWSYSKSNAGWVSLSEIILTIGRSKTVETYLKSAAHYHKFTVIVAESGPS
jgi:translation initiation factor eIF-2B subunit beta